MWIASIWLRIEFSDEFSWRP